MRAFPFHEHMTNRNAPMPGDEIDRFPCRLECKAGTMFRGIPTAEAPFESRKVIFNGQSYIRHYVFDTPRPGSGSRAFLVTHVPLL